MSEKAAEKMMLARTALILDQPFFGAMALKLKLVEDPSCPTAWTNGVVIGYSPKYVESLTHAQVVGLVAEEVMHCAHRHQLRRHGRDPKEWNKACDYALSGELRSAGIDTADMLYEAKYEGQAAETIFDQLPKPPPSNNGNKAGQQGQGQGQGQKQGQGKGQGTPDQQPGSGDPQNGPGQPGGQDPAANDYGRGAVRDAPAGQEAEQEVEWKAAVLQAAMAAKSQGKLPGFAQALIEQARRPIIDWKAELRRFMQQALKADYSFALPNRRYLGMGAYLPRLHSEQMPPVVVVSDTSGSVASEEIQSQFFGELASILEECRPEKVWFLQVDTRVADVQELEPGDPIRLTIKGMGGTDFRPAFQWVEQNLSSEPPAVLIYLTDLYGDFPNRAPEYPVLWACTHDKATAPWGTTLQMDLE